MDQAAEMMKNTKQHTNTRITHTHTRLGKRNLLIINKADYLSPKMREIW
jgi:hypothetical protein